MDVVKHLGGLAEETLTAIKVVVSFGREEKEYEKLVKGSEEAHIIGKRH